MRKKIALAAVLVGTILGSSAPAVANAATPKLALSAGANVVIRNVNSGLALQPTGASTANGATIVQQPYNSTTAQIWTTSDNGSASQFRNLHSQMNIGINGASTSPGATAIQATPSAATNQYWYPKFYSTGIYTLVNVKSGLCLGINGASKSAGAAAMQFACDGKVNQQWRIG